MGASIRQRKYVKGVLSGMSKRKAATEAGLKTPPSEKSIPVQQLFQEALAEAGITTELLAKTALQGLSATSVARETQYAKREVLVDFGERRAMLEFIARALGLIVDKKQIEAGPTLADLLEESFREEAAGA